MKRVVIVVLNWNSADDAMRCLDSLLIQKPHVPAIILVDNASKDNSVARLNKYRLKHTDAKIHFIRNDVNSGYSGGNNIGFMLALEQDYDYIGTLNPDAVADKAWVRELCQVLDSRPDTGIATGLMLNADGTHIDTSGEMYSTWGVPGPRLRGAPTQKAPTQPGYVFGSTGGGFIARAELFQKIGILDERFFMYYEDVDLCFRAQLAGFKVYYTPKAIAYHKIGASTDTVPGLAVKQAFKNLPMVFVKNVPASFWPHILPRFALTYVLIFGNAVVHGRARQAFSGFFLSLGLIPHMWSKRHEIQKSRSVPDDYIDSILFHDIMPEQTGLRKFRAFFTGRK